MSGLCGWFDGAPAGPVDPDVISTMATSITRFDEAAARKASKNFGAVALSAVGNSKNVIDIFQSDEQIVAVWGRPHFTDAHFAEIAQRLDQDIGSALLRHRLVPTRMAYSLRNIASRRAPLMIENLFVKLVQGI